MGGIALTVVFLDGTDRVFHVDPDNEAAAETWRITTRGGVPLLVVGRGVPRVEVPLGNVATIDVIPWQTPPAHVCGILAPDRLHACILPPGHLERHQHPDAAMDWQTGPDGSVWFGTSTEPLRR